MRTSGLDEAGRFPAGTTIEAVTFTVPDLYDRGTEFPTETDAVRAALERREQLVAASAAQPGNGGRSFVPERFSVDVRWLLREPDGTRTDMVARRVTYDTLAEGREHLDRLERHRPRQ